MSAIEKLFEEYDKMADYLEEGESSAEARKELELLRFLAFDYAAMTVRGGMSKVYCCNEYRCTAREHSASCRPHMLLKMSPERAKELGVEWAL